jgi:hypothetical protein
LSQTREREVVVWATLVHEFPLHKNWDIMRGSKMIVISPQIGVFYSQALEWLQIPIGWKLDGPRQTKQIPDFRPAPR